MAELIVQNCLVACVSILNYQHKAKGASTNHFGQLDCVRVPSYQGAPANVSLIALPPVAVSTRFPRHTTSKPPEKRRHFGLQYQPFVGHAPMQGKTPQDLTARSR